MTDVNPAGRSKGLACVIATGGSALYTIRWSGLEPNEAGWSPPSDTEHMFEGLDCDHSRRSVSFAGSTVTTVQKRADVAPIDIVIGSSRLTARPCARRTGHWGSTALLGAAVEKWLEQTFGDTGMPAYYRPFQRD